MTTKPKAINASVAARMRRQKVRDTVPEVAVRRSLFARGLRYRKHLPVPSLPRRTIDIAFTRAQLAIFVDGCFWHGCQSHRSAHKANGEWWQKKLEENRRRDEDTTRILTEHGWNVLRFWEHEDPAVVAQTIVAYLAPSEACNG